MFFVLCFLSLSAFRDSSNITIEPPLWFTGLKNQIFLMTISGENIGNFKPSISSMSIINSTKLDSPNYLFVYINMAGVKAGSHNIILENGDAKYSIPYEVRSLRQSKPRTFDSSDVIYLIMPDRFSDGNTSNDNIPMKYKYVVNREDPDARHGGDLLGILNHLDYLEDLGITALWLTPILENDVNGNSYHGYAATNMYKIDPRFGSNEEYVNLVKECHSHGIKMIQDMVFNHISSEHPWMFDPPSKNFFNHFDKFITTQHDLSSVYSPYASDYDREKLTTGWFVPSMPDVNQRNPYVARYLIQYSIFWIEYADIDGIRQDTYPYAFADFMADWAKEVTEQYPDFNIVGETFRGNPAALAFWQTGSKVNPKNTYLKSVMDFRFMELSNDAFFNANKAYTLHEHMGYDYLYANVSSLMRFVENHDTDRFFKEEPKDLIAYRQAMAFLLTVPGIPQLYYGTEVINFGVKSTSDGYVRKDFPGGWPDDKINYFLPEGRDPLRTESYNYLKTLLHYRKGNKVISKGSMKHFYPQDGIYAFERHLDDSGLFVFINGHNEDHTVELEQYQEVLVNGIKYRDIFTNKDVYLNESFTMKARDVLILEWKGNYSPIPPTPDQADKEKKKKIGIIVGSVVGGTVLIAAVAFAIFFVLRRMKGDETINSNLYEIGQHMND